MSFKELLEAANGRWPDILSSLGGISGEFLTDRHGPCPLCSTDPRNDRFRFDDKNGNGSWFCNQCGGKNGTGGGGDGFTLLCRSNGWDTKTGAAELEAFLNGGLPGLQNPAPAKKGKPYRQPEIPPPDAPKPVHSRATGMWCVRDEDGNPLYWDVRLPGIGGKGKIFNAFVWLDGRWHLPSKRKDDFSCEWPKPRPHYKLDELKQRPDAPVMLVEGQKAMDRGAELYPDYVVLTWSNGAKSVGNVDFSALAGRDCVIWPDNDKDGKVCQEKLIRILKVVKVKSIAVVAIPTDMPEGWDVGDV